MEHRARAVLETIVLTLAFCASLIPMAAICAGHLVLSRVGRRDGGKTG